MTLTVLKRYALFLPIAFVCGMPILPAVSGFTEKHPAAERVFAPLSTVCAALLTFVSLLFLIGQSYNPFIYFRF